MIRRILSAFGLGEFLKILVLWIGGVIISFFIAELIGANSGEVTYTVGILLFPFLVIRKVIQNRRSKKVSEKVKDA